MTIPAIGLIKEVLRLFQSLYAGYRLKMLGLSALGVLAGLFEGLGVSLLIPLFAIFLGKSESAENPVVHFLRVMFETFGISLSFSTLLLLIITLFLLKAATLFCFGYLRISVVKNYGRTMRTKLYQSVLFADYSFIAGLKSGRLENILLTDLKASAKLLEYVVAVVLSLSTFVVYLTVAFALSPTTTVFAALAGIAVLFAFRPMLRSIRRFARETIAVRSKLSHMMNEDVRGIKTLKAMHHERDVLHRASLLFGQTEEAERKKGIMMHVAKISIEPISIIFISIVFAISYRYLTFSIATFVPIVYLINQIFINIEKIQAAAHVLGNVLPNAESVDRLAKKSALYPEPPAGNKPYVFLRELSFKAVSFSYAAGGAEAVSDVSFSVKKGETVGIIGPSGAGKTTIVDLLLQLIRPERGEIAVDGINIEDIDRARLRRKVVYVPQEAFLRNDTIFENIRFYGDLSRERIEAASRLAHIHQFIISLPDGYDTLVGERGTRLSGGERQRVALARSLARDPDILVLDEATSALDSEAEAVIHEAIKSLRGRMTIIIIAHRLRTVSDADRIIVLEKGTVVETGLPADLARDPKSYFSRMLALNDFSVKP